MDSSSHLVRVIGLSIALRGGGSISVVIQQSSVDIVYLTFSSQTTFCDLCQAPTILMNWCRSTKLLVTGAGASVGGPGRCLGTLGMRDTDTGQLGAEAWEH